MAKNYIHPRFLNAPDNGKRKTMVLVLGKIKIQIILIQVYQEVMYIVPLLEIAIKLEQTNVYGLKKIM